MDFSVDDTSYYNRMNSFFMQGEIAGARCQTELPAGCGVRGGPVPSGGATGRGEADYESDVDVDDLEREEVVQDEEEPMVGVREQRQGWLLEQDAYESDDNEGDAASSKSYLEAPVWSRELHDVPVAPFAEIAGPKHNLPPNASVLDYFMLLWPERLFDVFTKETNRYAEQKIAESGKADPLWSPTTAREMKAFFAMAIMMGIKDLPRVWCYWSGNPALRCEWVSGTMTHTRYSKISQYLHARSNEGAPARGERGYDPIYKVRNVVEEVRVNFSRHYYPRCQLSVDEGMIPFKGRLFFKQHMPAKPTKWGVKVWELCEAETGYCLNFDIYTGRSGYCCSGDGDSGGAGASIDRAVGAIGTAATGGTDDAAAGVYTGSAAGAYSSATGAAALAVGGGGIGGARRIGGGGIDDAARDGCAGGAAHTGPGAGDSRSAGAGSASVNGRAALVQGARWSTAGTGVTVRSIANSETHSGGGSPHRLTNRSTVAHRIPNSTVAHGMGCGATYSITDSAARSAGDIAAQSLGRCTSHRTGKGAASTVTATAARSFTSSQSTAKSTAHSIANATLNASVPNRVAQSVTTSAARSYTGGRAIADGPARSTGSTADPRVEVPASEHRGLGHRVVLSLTRSYWHRNHHLYFDRYFTSPALLEDLRSRCGTYGCGTVSLARRGLPAGARDAGLRRRGDVAFFQKGELVLSVWRDKRVVATLSTNQQPRMVRLPGAAGGAEGACKPAPVVHYNKFMGGVDRSDQYRSYYAVGRASKKWWRYIVWFLLNLSIVNAWLLYRESRHEPPVPKNYDHFQFRVDLAEQLRGDYRRKGHHKGKRSRQVVSYVSADNMSAHRLVRAARGKKVCRLCSRRGRKTRAGRQVQTSFGCAICDVPLCRFGCFRDFHQV